MLVKGAPDRNPHHAVCMMMCPASDIAVLVLTHWGRVTYICIGKLTIIGSDNGLSPGRRQAIIWTNAGVLLIGPLGTNFSKMLIEIQAFSWKRIRLKMSSDKCCPFRLGLNVLTRAQTRVLSDLPIYLTQMPKNLGSTSIKVGSTRACATPAQLASLCEPSQNMITVHWKHYWHHFFLLYLSWSGTDQVTYMYIFAYLCFTVTTWAVIGLPQWQWGKPE